MLEGNATPDIDRVHNTYICIREALSLIYTRKLEAGPVGDDPNRYMHIICSTPPAVDTSPVTHSLDRNSTNVGVGNPLVITSANC